MDGCGLLGDCSEEVLVYFPTFVLEADTYIDSLLEYEPLGKLGSHFKIDFAQTSISASPATVVPAPLLSPVHIFATE